MHNGTGINGGGSSEELKALREQVEFLSAKVEHVSNSIENMFFPMVTGVTEALSATSTRLVYVFGLLESHGIHEAPGTNGREPLRAELNKLNAIVAVNSLEINDLKTTVDKHAALLAPEAGSEV